MAKKSAVAKNEHRKQLAEKLSAKRKALLAVARNRDASPEEIMEANMKLAKLPRNSAPIRFRNRCKVTGRPHGYYRKFEASRIALREQGSEGLLPGLVKSSW